MRLLAITPIHVGEQELARRQRRYDSLAPAGLTVHLEDLGTGSEVPSALETAEDIRASEAALVKRFGDADLTGVDGLLPDCVLDPVVEDAFAMPRPVFGLGRLSAQFAAGFGVRVGAVARNQAIADELDRKLASYGVELSQRTAVLDLAVEEIADGSAWTTAVARTVQDLPCEYVINACSAVDITPQRHGPVLLDPTQIALRLIGLQQELAPLPQERLP
jgi:Asp/Glu/hydantoin racemase